MPSTRSVIIGRTAAVAAVAVLGVVALGPALASSPRVAGQVITTGQSGNSAVQSGITVEGSGIVTVAPDEAILSVGVLEQASTASAAQQAASGAMTKVIAAVKGAGVADADLATQWISLQ